MADTSASTQRFAIRVDPLFVGLFTLLGAGRRHDYVQVGPDDLRVRLGPLFRARIPRSAVAAARHHPDMYGGWGAHGWGGRWLVNGSSKGIIQLDLEPRQRGLVLGVAPVSLATLWISLTDPDEFLDALRT